MGRFPASATDFRYTSHLRLCLTQRLWHFNHNFQLNDLTHCGDIFFLREKPLVICDVWNICACFSPRGKIVHILQPFILQNLFRVSVNEQLISALRSFVHFGFCGLSPHSVHLLHPFQKLWFRPLSGRYMNTSYSLLDMVRFFPSCPLFCIRKSNLLILVHITKEIGKWIKLIRGDCILWVFT